MLSCHRTSHTSLGQCTGCPYIGVDPKDLHTCRLRHVAETVRNVRRDVGDVMSFQAIFLVIDIKNGVSLHQHHTFFAVMAMKGNFDARAELGIASDESACTDTRHDQRSSASAAAAIML